MIGIFGGTFDPIHYGHLRSALEVKVIFGLKEIRLIPSAQPPHRQLPATTALMRVEMLNLAITNQQGLLVDTREIDRDGPSYMVDTLSSLRQEFPNEPILLFIGSDAFNHLTTWHKWQQLFDYSHIVVMTRPGFDSPIFLLTDYQSTELNWHRTLRVSYTFNKSFNSIFRHLPSETWLQINKTRDFYCLIQSLLI
jgi:nicotinate (nicotinamide) nucleotide adenylyltransferase